MTAPNGTSSPSLPAAATGPAPILVNDLQPYAVRAGRPHSTPLRLLVCWSDPYPVLEHGFRRVHLDGGSGTSVPPPGDWVDRYLMRFRPWATVDTREHLMELGFDCTTGDGRHGFRIDVTLNVRVTEPGKVVDLGVRRLRPYVQPDLWLLVHTALTEPLAEPLPLPAVDPSDAAAAMTGARLELEWLLRRTLAPGTGWDGDFYRALVVGCRVAPDERTARLLEAPPPWHGPARRAG